MKSYTWEPLGEKSRGWQAAKWLCIVVPFFLAGLFYLRFSEQIDLNGGQLTLSLTFTVVNLILAGTYYSAYKVFADRFYFFISVSWLAPAIFLLLDLNGPRSYSPEYSNYRLALYSLYLTSDILLLLALLHVPRDCILRGVIWVIVAATACFGTIYSLITWLGEDSRNLARWMLPGCTLSFGLLCTVGTVISNRFGGKAVGWNGKTIARTFYAFAVVQFFYPFTYTRTLGTSWWLAIFLIAQLAKIGNSIAMQSTLQSAVAEREAEKVLEQTRYDVKVREAELEAEEAKLQSKSQLIELGVLASSIKHDISTPLATMRFNIESLKDRYQHDMKLARKLESLEDSIERIYAIARAVDILRGDQDFFDRAEFMRKENMLEIVHKAVKSVKNEKQELKQYDSKNFIKIEGRDLWVRAYGPMFEQLIVNVIKNGLEAIEEGNRERGIIRINVGSTQVPDSRYSRWVRVEIEDNGVGIPVENLGRLTSLFTTRSEKKASSGIGLFMGKKIIDIHGGRMWFESKVAAGTKVTLLLPEWNAFLKAAQDPVNLPEAGDESLGTQELGREEPKVRLDRLGSSAFTEIQRRTK